MKAEELVKIRYSDEWFQHVSDEDAARYNKRNVARCREAIEYHDKKDRPLNILAIYGSGRGNSDSCARELSNSQLLLRGALEQFRGEPGKYEIVELTLRDYAIEPCLPASERVTTNQGLHSIAELVPGTAIPSGTVSRQWQTSPRARIVEIAITDGRRLRLTPNHRVKIQRCGPWRKVWDTARKQYVSAQSREDTWVAAGDLKSGDRVPFPFVGGFATPATERLDLAAMAGLVWGDGTFCRYNAVWLVPRADEDHIQVMRGRTPNWSSIRPDVHGMLRVLWSSSTTRELRKWGFDKEGAPAQRRLPTKIMRDASEAEVCTFLRHWFDTDGTIDVRTKTHSGRVQLSAASPGALRDAQLLLQKLGIHSRVRPGAGTTVSWGRPYARAANLTIQRKDALRRFAEKINFSLPRKKTRLDTFLRAHPNVRFYNAPIGKVVSVRDAGTAPVYDITVPGSHEFVVEGITVHNCNNCYASASALCGFPCDCFPLDGMQELYPMVLRCDAMLCATGVNQSAMSTRLKAFLDRLISLDGGFYRGDDFQPKTAEFKDKCIKLSTDLSKKKELPYDARMWGRAAAYFITSKDEKNESETSAYNFKPAMSYIELVAESLREGNADYGFFHDPEDWYAGAWADPTVEMAYDKRSIFSNPGFLERAKTVARKAAELAARLRENPPPFDNGGRGRTRT